jgi:steroid delta-isomerase-like uncharacterized protein
MPEKEAPIMTDHRLDRRQILKGAAALGAVGALAALHTPAPTRAAADALAHGDQIGQGWCDAWNSHNVDTVLAVFTQDVFYEDVTLGAVNRGSAALRAFAQAAFTSVPDIHLQWVTSAVAGGHGSIEWVFSGTDVGLFKTGKPFSVRGASVIEVRGGLISRDSDYWDAATVMREVGLLT